MRMNLMVEGQEGVTWNDWIALASACEDHGLEGLFRSDHYSPIGGGAPGRGSLDALTTMAGLGARTTRLRLGTLVSPVTFRHPSVLAKSAVTIDHISGGRFELGIGAGWYDHEHSVHGFPFPSTSERMRMLEEQIEIVHRQWNDDAFSFEGGHYRLADSDPRPKPVQSPHLPLLVGGAGGARSTALAARWADEYNTVHADVDTCRRRRSAVERAWERAGRDAASVRFSLMTGFVIGRRERDVEGSARRVMAAQGESGDAGRWLEQLDDAWIVGTVENAVDQLGRLGDVGVDRVMLQHLAHDDVDSIALLGEEVCPQIAPGGVAQSS
jgi:F420-dependent oxidoreductase-like protein